MFDPIKHKEWLLSTYKMKKPLRVEINLSNSIKAESFDVFVGHSGYPIVSFGPSASLSQPKTPNQLFGMEYKRIIESFLFSVRGKKFSNVHYDKTFTEKIQEIAMSYKPIDIEMGFSKKPKIVYEFSHITTPLGPSAPMTYLREEENPKIPRKVDSLYNEKINSIIGIRELYERGFDNYYITKIFSAGVLGVDKKLVPTRWSITAIDDMISKINIKRILDYNEIEDVMVFSSEFLYNKFIVLLIPGIWEFENFEAWSKGTSWGAKDSYVITEEYEGPMGRKTYATLQVGGYYASRFAVSEYLSNIKRQAKVIVFREIYEGYKVPVGVWQVRENVRNAFRGEGIKFNSISEALFYISKSLRFPIKDYIRKSRILGQTRITDF